MAATDESKLIVTLEARVRGFERALAKIQGDTTKGALAVKGRFGEMEKAAADFDRRVGALAGRMSGHFRALAATALTAFSAQKIIGAADAYARIQNALKVAGVSGAQMSTVFDRLYATAQRNAVPLESLAQLYGRVAQAQGTLKASTGEVLQVTEIVGQALRVSGKSAEEASGALLQLGQSLSGGKVQAEEYNSLLDGMYPLLQAAAAGMKQAGGDVARLTALVKDGKVSSEAFFRSIIAGAPTLTAKLAGSSDTVSAALTRFGNAAIVAAGEVDKATGATRGLIGILDALASRAPSAANAVVAAANAMREALSSAPKSFDVDYDAMGNPIPRYSTGQPSAGPAYTTGGGFGTGPTEREMELRRELARAKALAAMTPPVQPIDLARYPVSGAGKGGSANAYKTETAAIQEKIKALQAEAETVGASTYVKEKALKVVELTAAAEKAGIPVTAEVKANIDRLAGSYAAAAQHLEEMERKQRAAIQAADDFRSATGDVTKGFVNDLMNGVTAAEAFSNALRDIASRFASLAIDRALLALLGPSGTTLSSSGSVLGSVLHSGGIAGRSGTPRVVPAGAYASAPRYHSGFMPGELPAILKEGEAVLNDRLTGRMGRAMSGLVQAASQSATAAAPSVVYSPQIDARGADMAAVARLERIVQAQAAEIDRLVRRPARQASGMRT